MKKRVSCNLKYNSNANYLLVRFTGSVIYPNDIDLCALESFKKIIEISKDLNSKIWLIIDFSFLDVESFSFAKEIDSRINNTLSEYVEEWVAISRHIKQRIKLNFLFALIGKNTSFYSTFATAENAIIKKQAKKLFS